MKKITPAPWLRLFLINNPLPRFLAASVVYDTQIRPVSFAAKELQAALTQVGRSDLKITPTVAAAASAPEAFQIQAIGPNEIKVTGSNTNSTMYGGIEIAEYLKLGVPIVDDSRSSRIVEHGIKSNILFRFPCPLLLRQRHGLPR